MEVFILFHPWKKCHPSAEEGVANGEVKTCFPTMQSPKWQQYCRVLRKMNWAPSLLHECEHPRSRDLGCLDSVHFSARERCRRMGTLSERGLRKQGSHSQ